MFTAEAGGERILKIGQLMAKLQEHRRRHGFEVGGHKLQHEALEKIFLVCPQICIVPPNSRGTAGAYHGGKTYIVKITRVKKKQGTVDLATS